MRVLAVTCYTGGNDLCIMTERMLDSLRECSPPDLKLLTAVTAQGVSMEPGRTTANFIRLVEENVGFAFGMNAAVDTALRSMPVSPDFILCLNNDLRFPHQNWLKQLLLEANANLVSVPRTDKTAIRSFSGPEDMRPTRVEEMSAYCWLVPFPWCRDLKERYGWWLFDEDFRPGRGEDNWTAFKLSRIHGPKPFQIVHRSFVKHLRGRTCARVKMNPRHTNQVLVRKLQGELKTKLRPDLRQRAKNYIRMLSKRC